MNMLEIGLGQDDYLFLSRPCDSVIFINRRRKRTPSNDISSFEIFARATRLEVYLFNSSEHWVVSKHVSGKPDLSAVYFTKRLVGLFDLAHVRSLIVFLSLSLSLFFFFGWQ